jgi:hypothetical protein
MKSACKHEFSELERIGCTRRLSLKHIQCEDCILKRRLVYCYHVGRFGNLTLEDFFLLARIRPPSSYRS